MIVTALQVFLTYFSLMLSPRIVAWRASAPERFRQRVLLVAAGLVGLGLGVCGATWALREIIIRLLCGPSFLPAAGLLPVLVFGKFAALASGVLVWALLACQKDWLPVQLCFPVVAAGFTLHWLLVPRVGTSAAAWLNWSMEASLLGLCLVAVFRLRVERASA
jgi:O-antigen/teichoic acid export membrane protein